MARPTRAALALAALLIVVSGYCLWRPAIAPGPRPRDAVAISVGGSLTGSMRSDPGNYLRYIEATGAAQALTNLLDARLVRFNRDTDAAEPALAESWTASDDGLTYTFRLRQGVRFSDGTPFTAADVEFSARLLYDPGVNSALAQATMVDGKPLTITAPDPNTVVVSLPSRFAPGIRLLENLPIVPKHKLEAALNDGRIREVWKSGTAPSEMAGLGPFVLTEHTAGSRLVFARNPHYWRKDAYGVQLPYLDGLTLLVLPDQGTETMRFIAGGIDFMVSSNPRPEDIASLKREQAAGRVHLLEHGATIDPDFLWFSTVPTPGTEKRPWLQEKAFRQAISYSVDRQGLANGPYLGTAVPIHGPVTEGNPTWHSRTAPQYPLDRAKAKQLLASVALEDRDGDGKVEDPLGTPARFSILTQAGHLRERAATYIQDQLRQSGLTVDLVTMDPGGLQGRWGAQDYDGIYFYLPASSTDPALNRDFWLSSGFFHVWNPKQLTPATPWEAQVDELMKKQAAALTLAERQALFAEVQRIMGEELPAIYFVAQRVYIPITARVLNAKPAVQAPQLLWEIDTLAVAK